MAHRLIKLLVVFATGTASAGKPSGSSAARRRGWRGGEGLAFDDDDDDGLEVFGRFWRFSSPRLDAARNAGQNGPSEGSGGQL